VLGITPGVNDFVSRPLGSRLFSKDDGEVYSAPAASCGGGGGKARSLAAPALDDEAFWAPPVDPAELHLLDIVVSLYTLDYGHYQLPLSLETANGDLSKPPLATLSPPGTRAPA
jgi:hypothetical protein